MRRLILTAICVIGMVPAATAVELTAVGSTVLPYTNPGEQVTIEFSLTNLSEEEIFGLGISAYGYENALIFDEGSAVGSYLDAVCIGPGSCFGGLSNLAGGALAESAIGANENRVQVAISATLTGVSNPGLGVDQGLDGQVGSAMFSLTFTLFSPGQNSIRIGTAYQGDGIIRQGGVVDQIANELVYTFAPEPGTALLIGLGLAGMSSSGQRRRK